MHLTDRQDIEVQLFIQALRLRHGYDFTQYAPASLKRRVQALAGSLQARNISEITERLVHDDSFVSLVIERLSVPVSELFREPASFRVIREEVLQDLASLPRHPALSQ